MASKLSRRAYLIEQNIFMLGAMSERMRYLRPSMRALLQTLITLYPALGYLRQCNEDVERGDSFSSAWRKSIYDFDGIEAQEREILLSIGDTLGSSNLENQIAAIACTRSSLEERLTQAREDINRHGRLYRALGALGGIALAIILF